MIGRGKGHGVTSPTGVKRFEGVERDYILKVALEWEHRENNPNGKNNVRAWCGS